MELFNSLIKDTLELLKPFKSREYPYSENELWNDEGHSSVILQRDCAYELKGTGFNLVTSSELSDRVIVCGKELKEIKSDCSFVRISLISVENTDDEQKAFDLIKKAEYVKYHVFPEGYMIRSTSTSNKEAVRISKKALRKGIDFYKTGNLLISKYKEIPEVKAVTVIFVTEQSASFEAFFKIADKSTSITKALNHIMEKVNFDCDSCNLKPLCDEVEGMRELHFKSAGRM